MVHTAFLLISAEIHFSKQNKALLHLILNSFQSWSSRLKVNLYSVIAKSLSLQLCLSQAFQGSVPYFTPCSASLTVAGIGETQRKNWDFLPQIQDKFWLSLDNPVSVLQLQCWRPLTAARGSLHTCQSSAEDQVPKYCFTSLADLLQVEIPLPAQHHAAGVPQDRQHSLHPQHIAVLTCKHYTLTHLLPSWHQSRHKAQMCWSCKCEPPMFQK